MKRLPLLLLATSTLLSLASCDEAKMDAINSLKDGFLALNTQRNYTFNYSLNNIDSKILFTDKSIGFIETVGFAACVAAADAAVKSANVKLLGYEYAKGDGMCTVKVEGNVGACKAAIEAGRRAAEAVNGSLSGTKSVRLIARPATGMRELMVDNRETVG